MKIKLGQVSSLTSSLEVERSLDSCTLAVHRPLAYFRSANLKTFCREFVADSVIQAIGMVEFEDGLKTGVLLGGYW